MRYDSLSSTRLISAIALGFGSWLWAGSASLAETISGTVTSYAPERKEATIDIGSDAGIRPGDLGAIALPELSRTKGTTFSAFISVIDVTPDSATIEVRESESISQAIAQGLPVIIDASESPSPTASNSASPSSDPGSSSASASPGPDSNSASASPDSIIIDTSESPSPTASNSTSPSSDPGSSSASASPDSIIIDTSESPSPTASNSTSPSSDPGSSSASASPDSDNNSDSDTASAPPIAPAISQRFPQSSQCSAQSLPELSDSNLPQNYLDAYAAARTQPSPQTYYAFAKTLIDYELADEALLWLGEAEACFPRTRAVNRLYQAVAFGQKDRFAEAELALNEASQFAGEPIFTDIKSYLLTRQGKWEEVIALAESNPSDVNVSNYLIAQYCTNPPELERDSDIPPSPCPFGNVLGSVEPSEEGREQLTQITMQFGERETENPYLLNTLGFLALQMEDYDLAFRHYTQLAGIVAEEDRDRVAPSILALQESADIYVRNYNQNNDFLKEKEQNLDLLRSRRRKLTAISTGIAAASIATRIGGSSSTGSIIGTGIIALAQLFGGRGESKRLKREQRELLDSVRQTFLADITVLPARPDLDPNLLLRANRQQNLTGSGADENLGR